MGERRAREHAHGDPWQYCVYAFAILLLLFSFYGVYLAVTEPPPPWYSVAVGAVSGLDPATDLQQAQGTPLDPAFNLTVRIDASLSAKDKAPYCLDKGTPVKVSYLRVPLAVGRAPEPGEGTCAAAGQRRDLAVVARGRGVIVPGFLLDSLAEDVQRGEAVFDVTLMSRKAGDGDWKEMTCWGKVGDDAPLQAPCVMDDRSPAPCPGTTGYVPRPRKVVRDDVADDGSPAPAGTPEHKSWSIMSQ